MTTFKQAENDNFRLRIEYDTDPENPRTDIEGWLGTMVCWHRRYTLGDKHKYSDPQDFARSLLADFIDPDKVDRMGDKKVFDELQKYVVILPLFLYDHSGLSMNTGGFSCPWDSGQVGYIYVTRQAIREQYEVKSVHKNLRNKVLDILKAEVAVYDEYLRGNVFGFVLEKKVTYKSTEDEDDTLVNYEEVDSCWGFIGEEHLMGDLVGHVGEQHKELVDNLAYC